MKEEVVAEETAAVTDEDSKLKIVTRSPAGEKITYPVTVFVMDGEGNCITKESLADANDELSVKLPAGTYQVYGIAGATEDSYTIPAAVDASANYEIALKQGTVHADLMAAQNIVTLGANETNVLTLGFTRKVMNVKTITINNVPEDVTALSVKLTPLYKSISLNGNYVAGSGDAQTATVSLTRQEDGTTWKNTSECYLMPAVSAATITVKMTLDGNIISSSYSSSQTLQANSDLNITGTYTGNAGAFTMSGVFTGAVWGAPTNINFTFNESGAEAAGGSQSGGGNAGTGGAPALNTWYSNCFVFMSEEVDDHIVVTLLHCDDVTVIDAENKTLAEINTLVQSFDSKGLSGWRLPTETEAKEVRAVLYNVGLDPEQVVLLDNFERYFYETDDHTLGAFLGNGNISATLVPTMHIRPVTTLSFPKQ